MSYNENFAKNHLEDMVIKFEHRDFKSEDDVNEMSNFIKEQVIFVYRIELIQTIMLDEYLSRIERKRIEELKKIAQKEYREQVINFNDDIITDKEKLLLARQQEKKNIEESVMSVNQWLDIMDNNSNSQSSSNNEREILTKEKERNERNIF